MERKAGKRIHYLAYALRDGRTAMMLVTNIDGRTVSQEWTGETFAESIAGVKQAQARCIEWNTDRSNTGPFYADGAA